ncbi:unnamed protein product [Didymodactylos carnosus]|uniref:Protein kinase domain-containing protein n=1 Tax=Didymodactylos carnosus TaxID=1234261 RepID=A0A815IZJ5_9BILA|nr:unnamed protein product [Didymodactylos carnosus]CAF1373405.1 unnamed protein product [Didymodactylos carnosus]CAF3950979.1 unnamed protein product [Didymodactylos carnosus]CAF4261708.1 unnamed protein product [Didymodactylos carnosus]
MKMTGARVHKEAAFYVDLSRHLHICRTYGFIDEIPSKPFSVMLVQEFAPKGNLFDLLEDSNKLPKDAILRKIFIQIVDAMCYLVDNQIIHGDLACRNVLVFQFDEDNSENNLVKITDFGLTRVSSSCTVFNIIPTRYAAPEVLSFKLYSEKSDVFSMGVLMWEAYSKGAIPWINIDDLDEISERVTRGERLPRPDACNNGSWSLISSCMFHLTTDRPTFAQLKQLLDNTNKRFFNVRKSSHVTDQGKRFDRNEQQVHANPVVDELVSLRDDENPFMPELIEFYPRRRNVCNEYDSTRTTNISRQKRDRMFGSMFNLDRQRPTDIVLSLLNWTPYSRMSEKHPSPKIHQRYSQVTVEKSAIWSSCHTSAQTIK